MFVCGVDVPNNVVAGRTGARLKNALLSAHAHAGDNYRTRVKAQAVIQSYRTAKPRLRFGSFAQQLAIEVAAASLTRGLRQDA